VVIENDFEEICTEAQIADKLQTLEAMCAQQGIIDGQPDPSTAPAPPTKLARLAALKAKQEEAKKLAVILEDIQRKEKEAEEALEQKKKTAHNLMAVAAPLGGKMAEIQAVAKQFTQRQMDTGVSGPS
jgi:hypothetical protein